MARQVDQSALRVNQAFIIALLVLSFLFNTVWLVALVGVVMLVGTIWPEAALFKRVYRHVLRPAGLVQPDVIADNPEPHRFAQGFGAVVVLAAVAGFVTGAVTLGWVLTGVVVFLAALNLFLGFCAGCFVYYQLNRLGVPGFSRSPMVEGR